MTLEYAPAVRQRRKFWKGFLACSGIVGAILAWRLAAPIYRQACYILEQRRLLLHEFTPGGIAFEPDAERAQKLINSGPDYYMPTNLRWRSPETQVLLAPQMQPIAFYLPPSLSDVLPKPNGGEGLIFAHARRTSRGVERLVIVWVGILTVNSPGDFHFAIVATAYVPATIKPGSRLTIVPQSRCRIWHQPVTPPLRVYGGTPDLRDASHFSFAYDLGHSSGTIDGWLRDPDDVHPTEHIILDARDGPLDSMHNL